MATGLTVAKPILKKEIKDFLTEFKNRTNENASPDEYIEQFAEKLSVAIHNYVTEAIVRTTGSATAQVGGLS